MHVEHNGARAVLARMWSRGFVGVAAMILAILACYGTLALLAALSALGVRLALNDAAWSGVIVLFTLLTVATVVPGARRHRSAFPASTAVAGALLIVYVLYVEYDLLIEAGGFALLAGAACGDVVLRRKGRPDSAKTSTGAPTD